MMAMTEYQRQLNKLIDGYAALKLAVAALVPPVQATYADNFAVHVRLPDGPDSHKTAKLEGSYLAHLNTQTQFREGLLEQMRAGGLTPQ